MSTPQGTWRAPARQRLMCLGLMPNSSAARLCDAERLEGRAEFGRAG